jgi:uncharacterized protein
VESSPFPHHGPLRPEQVHGRDDLIATLAAKVTARRVTALLGPRRFGKTSVLRRLAADLEAASTSVLWIDLYEVTSTVDVAIRVDEALDRSRGGIGELVRRIAASAELSLGAVKLSFAKPTRPDPTVTLHMLLDVIVESCTSTPTVIMLDEFSSIARVPGAAALFRTKLQHHFDEIGLVFAGSEPSTMRMLFADREQPFYGQADLVPIGPLSGAAVHELVTAGFRRTGRDPGGLPSRIHQLCAGHPRRTMQAADTAWELAVPGEPYRERLWADTVAELELATADAGEVLFAGFNDSEKKVLRILASGGSIYGRAAELLALNPSPARQALANLTDGGHVDDGVVVDPLFAHWLRRRLPV